MTSSNVPAVAASGAIVQSGKYTPEEIATIKANHFKNLEDHQISYALTKAARMGLDFFTGDVVCWPGPEGRVEVYTTISGLRSKAEETGMYFPGRAPTFEHDDNGNLISATAYVKRWDDRTSQYHEIEGIALMVESGAKTKGAWTTHKHAMLAKCAEAFALRRAFSSLGSLYLSEERDTVEDVEQRKAQDRDAGRGAVLRKLSTPEAPAQMIAALPKDLYEPAKQPAIETTAEKIETQPPAEPAATSAPVEPQEDDLDKLLADTQAIVSKLSVPKKIVLFKQLGMSTDVKLEALSPEVLEKVFDAAVKLRG